MTRGCCAAYNFHFHFLRMVHTLTPRPTNNIFADHVDLLLTCPCLHVRLCLRMHSTAGRMQPAQMHTSHMRVTDSGISAWCMTKMVVEGIDQILK